MPSQTCAAAADREVRAREANVCRAQAEVQSDAPRLAALRRIAAVGCIGPMFMTNDVARKRFSLLSYARQRDQASVAIEFGERLVLIDPGRRERLA